YKVFSPFFSKAKELPIRKPQKHVFSNLSNEKIKSKFSIKEIPSGMLQPVKTEFKGGRKSCIALLKNIKNLKKYDSERNFPSIEGTSHLSAHNKFGTYSIREVYHKIADDLGANHTLIAELHWRDFFTHIMYHFPHSKSKEFNSKYEKIPWSKNSETFTKWCNGMTGFPIVDAGMRELNNTGYMHNRVRMIVASFLTKDLHIDWRLGENYFASRLIDYDSSVNVGNWQWAASTGCDAQPWFRIFNPWLQQQKFDKDCLYIKKWIPELDAVSTKIIHSLDTKHSDIEVDYPAPIVDHKSESLHSKEVFKRISSG
ncbi:MAG: deoxyribodipyrimidine photo-lyase, partial [Nitrosopumilus sp.]|nr:deoxyribodipyrimidine photo-lyase [Nitrosopumilus sp.]